MCGHTYITSVGRSQAALGSSSQRSADGRQSQHAAVRKKRHNQHMRQPFFDIMNNQIFKALYIYLQMMN